MQYDFIYIIWLRVNVYFLFHYWLSCVLIMYLCLQMLYISSDFVEIKTKGIGLQGTFPCFALKIVRANDVKIREFMGNQYSMWWTQGHGNEARLILGHENETSQPTHTFPERRPRSYKDIAFNYPK